VYAATQIPLNTYLDHISDITRIPHITHITHITVITTQIPRITHITHMCITTQTPKLLVLLTFLTILILLTLLTTNLHLLKLLVQVIPWAFEASEVCIIVLAAFFMITILFHEYRLQGNNSEKSQLATRCTIYNEYTAMYNDYIPDL